MHGACAPRGAEHAEVDDAEHAGRASCAAAIREYAAFGACGVCGMASAERDNGARAQGSTGACFVNQLSASSLHSLSLLTTTSYPVIREYTARLHTPALCDLLLGLLVCIRPC
jgi:hypothetical protein